MGHYQLPHFETERKYLLMLDKIGEHYKINLWQKNIQIKSHLRITQAVL